MSEASNTDAKESPKGSAKGLYSRAFGQILKRKMAMASFIVIFLYSMVAVLGFLGLLPDHRVSLTVGEQAPSIWFTLVSWFGTLTPEDVKVMEETAASSTYLVKIMGTDQLGYPILYKVLAGTKTAMFIGFTVTAISIPIGIFMGAISGYYGGKIDVFVVWLYTVITSVPGILMVIAISYALGKGMTAVCIALGVTGWVGLCRLIRGEFLKHRNREYVMASKLLGAGDMRIIFIHILPNTLHLAIITASLRILAAIKSEVILTFLGVGVTDGSSWGTMISAAANELTAGTWWPLVSVVLAMFFIIYSLNVAGDALRDALDPKLLD